MISAKKWGAVGLCAAMAVTALAGCTQLKEKTDAETVFATFGKENITLDYAKVQLNQIQYGYEAMFSAYYGTTNFWDQDLYGDGSTMEAHAIENVILSMRQTKVLNWYASENGITLTEEQQKLVDDAVKETMNQDDSEYLNIIGMTEDLCRTLYTENAIANAAYAKLVEDVDTTVGDDEFIQKDITYVRLAPSDLEELTTEVSTEVLTESENASEVETTENGTEEDTTAAEATTEAAPATEEVASAAEEETKAEKELSEEERKQQDAIAEAVEDIKKRLTDGEDPADFVTEYNEDTTYFTATRSTSTISESSTNVFAGTAFALATGETATYTDESNGSVYILYCTNDNDEEARQNAINSEIESRKSKLFSEKYADIQSSSPKFAVNQDVLAKISFSNALYVAPEVTSDAEIETEDGTAAEIETEVETSVETEAETETETETA